MHENVAQNMELLRKKILGLVHAQRYPWYHTFYLSSRGGVNDATDTFDNPCDLMLSAYVRLSLLEAESYLGPALECCRMNSI